MEDSQGLDSKFVPLADTSPPKTSPGFLMMVIGGGIVCGLVILAGWWLFSEKAQPPSIVPQEISRQNVLHPETPPAIPGELQPTRSATVSDESEKPSADMVIPPKAAEQNSKPAPAKIPQPSSPATAPGKTLPVSRITAGVQEITIPLLSDQEIKLQAITWSKNPQKRITVINNKILRQGEMVLSYRIDIINQDDVVLSDGGKKWKLPFRIK
jgi:hypothetical protein